MEWVISIIPRHKMCFNNSFTIFVQYFYNIFARRVFTTFTTCSQGACFPIVFTIFLAERFSQCFYKYSVSPFYSFLQYTYTGEDGGSGLTFIYSLRFLHYSLSLSASNWDYLYYSLLRQGNSLILFWGREGNWGYLYC